MSNFASALGVETDARVESLVDTQLVYAHSIAALTTVLVSVLFGIIISLQFILPDVAGSCLSMAWGRLRYSHTQGIMIGWLGNAFLAFLYHAVPVLAGRKVTSAMLGRWLFGLWNFIVVIPGWLLVLYGISQPIEWAEFPPIVDYCVIVALVLAGIQFLPPFFKNGLEDLYVSSWYIIGSLVFTLLAYPMGNIVPELVPGAESAAFTGLWIHDAVGLFVTPLALSVLYFVIPATTGRPVFSHFLSMLGFWGLFLLYPLNGTHHYVFSVIPMSAQMGAIAASALLGVIVIIVVTNLLLSSRGGGGLKGDTGLRFAIMATVFYLVVSVQGALQAQMSLNRVVHFSDWVIGHSHLAMLGFATFAGIGGIVHAWQRIPWARYNNGALNWAFWLLTAGVILMFLDLTIAGLVQSMRWLDGSPWMESVRQARPYWLVRTLSAVPITAGFVLVFIGLVTGPRGAGRMAIYAARNTVQASPKKVPATTTGQEPAYVLRMSYRLSATAAIVFFCLSIILLGVLPGRALDDQISGMTPDNVYGLSESEQRGRVIYAREGCAYCHTQQIRYTDADMARFGAPTLAWEGQFDAPHMWGTRRVGPDLSRSSGTRSMDWHFAHLYAPRDVVPWSIMPSYAGFFDGAADKPTQEARDLVAYLESLGRARELAWPDGDARARALYPDDRWAQMSLNARALNNHPGRPRLAGNYPALADSAISGGEQLWQSYCVGCHGPEGRGDGPAAEWMLPKPANLGDHTYTSDRLAEVLWHGIAGTAMPAWRDLPAAELSALAGVVASFQLAEPVSVATASQLVLGKAVYNANCVQCHGEAGDGRGFAALELAIAPTDFTRVRPHIGQSVAALANGVEGTPMAPWTDRLTEEEILAVTHYLRAFFEEQL